MLTPLTEVHCTLLARKGFAGLALLAVLAVVLATLVPPAPVSASSQEVTPTPTPVPLPKPGSNAHLVIGALVLLAIIIFGVVLNIRRRK